MNICLPFPAGAAGPGVSFLAYLSKLPCEKGCPVWRTAAGKYSLPIASPPVCIQYPDNPAQVFPLQSQGFLSKLSQCAAESLKIFLRTGLGLPEGIIGAALTILTFGDYARWHPHIHTIIHGSLGCP